MKNIHRGLWLILISMGFLFLAATQTHASSYTLVKIIELNPLVGDDGSIEVDVVGNQLYVANWIQDKYFRIDPITGNLLGSFSLSNGILMDNHGSEYNPTTGRILHVSDDDAGGPLGFDAFFETDTEGVLLRGPYNLFGAGDNSEDPNALTVDPVTGRVWVSAVSSPGGITEINPTDGTILNQINLGGGAAWALGFNPNSRKLFFADHEGVIWEIAPDGTGLAMVFDPGVGPIYGMAFTPTGDLVLLDFAAPSYGIPPPSRLLLYDSSDDADNVFTTTAPAPKPIDTMSPTGSVHAYPNMIWPPNNQMVTITLDGYVVDEMSIDRDAGGIGVSNAYLMIGETKITLREGNKDLLSNDGKFSITTQVKAGKGAVYKVELYAADTKPTEEGGPNSGLVDSTSIRAPHDMSGGKSD